MSELIGTTSSVSTVNEISGALEGLAIQISATSVDARSMMEIWGWNLPGLSIQEVADLVTTAKTTLLSLDTDLLPPFVVNRLAQFPARIQFLRTNVVPHFAGGNAAAAWTALSGMLEALTSLIDPYRADRVTPMLVADGKSLTGDMIKELRSIERALKTLRKSSGDIAHQIIEIQNAHAVAISLPADIAALEDARQRYELAVQRILEQQLDIERKRDESQNTIIELKDALIDAKKTIDLANAAYGAATSAGLGASFQQRATQLSWHTFWLGALLLLVLTVGTYITYNRVEFVHQLMLNPKIDFNIIWLNLAFTAVSISAPIWMAWLLTRQIGQRFRLAEDYGYKASVAKAYEGYRNEARNVDPILAKRLFDIALDRLDEAPLRLVEQDSPGSPAQDRGLMGALRMTFMAPRLAPIGSKKRSKKKKMKKSESGQNTSPSQGNSVDAVAS